MGSWKPAEGGSTKNGNCRSKGVGLFLSFRVYPCHLKTFKGRGVNSQSFDIPTPLSPPAYTPSYLLNPEQPFIVP